MKLIKLGQSYKDLLKWLDEQGKNINQVIKEVTSNPPDNKGGNQFWIS